MNLSDRIQTYINAGFSGNWILTYEPEEVQRELTRLAVHKGYEIVIWDFSKGLVNPRRQNDIVDPKTKNPLSPLLAYAKPDGNGPRIVLLWNYHMFIKEREILQGFYNAILKGQEDQVFYFVMSCYAEIPQELQKVMVLHSHNLPADTEIGEIANNLLEKPEQTKVNEDIVHAARGLTRREIEGAFSLSISKNNEILAKDILVYKGESLRKSGFLNFYEGDASFKKLCGMASLKWMSKNLLAPKENNSSLTAKGILLVGPPGTGKSQFAKALGGEVNRPVLLCDLGKIYSKHVGETEGNLRELINIAESIAPCILFIDEIEKALGGGNSDGDSGVSRRVLGKLLTWLNDKTSDVFVIGTCNNVKILPPEFTRSGRFDGSFFIDLPTQEEREKLWEYYLDKYSLDLNSAKNIQDEGWTGAEIEECVKKSKQLSIGMKEAEKYIIPVSVSRREEIETLRKWSENRCMSSTYPGRYVGLTEPVTTQPTGKRRALMNGEV